MTFEIVDVGALDRLAPQWDAAVERTPGADTFCASSIWSFSAATSFTVAGEPVIVSDGMACCGLRPLEQDGMQILVGLDPVWGFATPTVGPAPPAADALAAVLDRQEFDVAVIAGQSADGDLTAAIAGRLDADYDLFVGPTEQRLRCDLSAGFDAWFARRSSRFRQRIRGVERAATAAGVEVVDISEHEPTSRFARLLAIEATSWKGRDGTGLASADLQDFYREMCRRLDAIAGVRCLVARRDDQDVGYILGGVRGSTYRGLQLSYTVDATDLSIGHLLQLAQLRRLDDAVDTYDMGMEMAYKERWADRRDETISVIVRRR